MVRKIPIIAVLLAMFLTCFGSTAFAQSHNTWLPEFQPGQKVYIDPHLRDHPSYPVRFDQLERKLEQAEDEHGLNVYFIATEQGADIAFHRTPAIAALEDLQVRWSSNPQLEKERYLIVLWVRRADNPNKGSVAGVGGSVLKGMGLDENYFSDGVNGPIVPFLRAYMPADPEGLVVNVAKEVNDDISSIEFKAMLPTYIVIGVGILLILGLFAWITIRFRSRKAKALAMLDEWREKFGKANPKYISLKGDYMGLLSERADWRERLIGTTRRDYENVLTKFALFTARLMAVGKRLEEAEDDFDDAKYPLVGKFDSTIAKLSTIEIAVTEKNIPDEDATLFGDLVESAKYEPGQLLSVLEADYEEIKSELAAIDNAFKESRKNKKDIEKLIRAIETIIPSLEAAGLTFEPYQKRFDSIKARLEECVKILDSDPKDALKASEEIESHSESLKADLLRAIELKSNLQTVLARIEEVEARVAETRKESATYAYQLDGEEAMPEAFAEGETFKLEAEGGNPDPVLSKARDYHAEGMTLVYEGKLDEADQARHNARETAEDADDLIDSTKEAKRFVETNVTNARTTHGSLVEEIPGGHEAVEALEAGFLADNIEGYRDRLNAAIAVDVDHGDAMATIKRLYDEQNYLAARQKLVDHQAAIDGSRQDIRSTHAWLATLTKHREDSRATVKRIVGYMEGLLTKHRDNHFTTSQTTSDRLDEAEIEVTASSEAAAETKADWPALDQSTRTLERTLRELSRKIDLEKAAYDEAVAANEAARKALSSAKAYFVNEYVRDDAKGDKNSASKKIREVTQGLEVAHNDWAALKTKADDAKRLAESAKTKAKNDIAKAEAAVVAIKAASDLIQKFEWKSYGEGVDADLDDAKRDLSSAESYFGRDDYENAKKKADEAYESAEDADDDAEDEVDDIRAARRRRQNAARASTTTNFNIGSPGGGPRMGGGNIGGTGVGGGNTGGTGVGGGNY